MFFICLGNNNFTFLPISLILDCKINALDATSPVLGIAELKSAIPRLFTIKTTKTQSQNFHSIVINSAIAIANYL